MEQQQNKGYLLCSQEFVEQGVLDSVRHLFKSIGEPVRRLFTPYYVVEAESEWFTKGYGQYDVTIRRNEDETFAIVNAERVDLH